LISFLANLVVETFIEAALVSGNLALGVYEAAGGGSDTSAELGTLGPDRGALAHPVLAAGVGPSPDVLRQFAPFFTRLADAEGALTG